MLPIELWEHVAMYLENQDDRLALKWYLGRPYIKIAFNLPLQQFNVIDVCERCFIIAIGDPHPFTLVRLRQGMLHLANVLPICHVDIICIGVIVGRSATIKVSIGFTDIVYDFESSAGFTDMWSGVVVCKGRRRTPWNLSSMSQFVWSLLKETTCKLWE